MSSASALAIQPVAIEIHALLKELDPARWRADAEQTLRAKVAEIEVRIGELRALLERRLAASSVGLAQSELRDRVAQLEALLRSRVADLRTRAEQGRDDWMDFRARLQPAYEQLAQALQAEAVHVPSLRPTNYKRNLMHVISGFVAFGVIRALPAASWLISIAALFAAYAWTMEFFRRRSPAFNARVMAIYGPVAHAHEWHRINSGTWYCTALLIIALTGSPLICAIAVLVLGIGDPAAALVGRRWGRTKLVNGRSLEGSLTFVAAATALVTAMLTVFEPSLGLAHTLALAGAASVGGAVAELFSRRIDDNLTIPVAAGLCGWLLSLAIL